MAVSFRILGPLEAWEDGRELPVSPGRQRALLALLVLHANEVISSDRLVDELWAGRPPASAQKVLQKYVSQLRRALPAGTIATRGAGYLLVAGETDAAEFERLAKAAAEQEAGEAARTLRQALGLWRGPPLADVEYEDWARVEIARLQELRVAAIEDRIEADLELGRHAQLVPELEALVAEHPLRERLRGQLMLALYRCDRQADALETYRRGRRELVEQLGLEPSPLLEQLEKQILTHDEALRAPGRRVLPGGTVTLLFTDIEGSTRLLKQLGDRYGEVLDVHRRILRGAAEAREGREVDTQGDSCFFAFARANDALGAAVAAQRELAAHAWPEGAEVRVRMGLHTGEPAVGGERYVGLGVHRAARIGAAAHGGQVLLSSATRELVADEVGGVAVRELGSYRLKDIDQPERLFQLDIEGLETRFPPLRARRVALHPLRRRAVLVPALAGVLAAAVAIPVFALGQGGGGRASLRTAAGNSLGFVDPSTNRLVADVPVGASPAAVTAGAGAIWVASTADGTVDRVDRVTHTVRQTITVGNGPAGIAFGAGFVWVTNALDGTVSRIDPKTNTVVGQAIRVGSEPAGVAADSRDVWVANSSDGTVSELDARTGTLVRKISVGRSADGIALGYDSVWVTSAASGTVTRIDARSGIPTQPIQAGSGADAVAAGSGGVWVANSLDGTVTRIDPATNVVRATIPVGDGPSGIAAAGGAVWVSNELAGTLSRIDPLTNTPVQTRKTGNRPEGIFLDSGALFVAVRASGAGHRGGTLTVLFKGGVIDTLDPGRVYIPQEDQVVVLTNDGLVGFRKAGGAAGTHLVADLAVALPAPTDGGRSYTFRVRPGIHYSTGALVRPQDFRYAIERSLELGSGNAKYVASIVGAATCKAEPNKPCDLSRGIATDSRANTVTFHLRSPDPDFLYALALPAAFAVPVGTPLHPRGFVPATGPYMVASFDRKRALRLVRNPRFHEWSPAAQPAGFPDAIVERFQGTADERVAAVVRGSADLASSGPTPSAAVLASLRTQHASLLRVDPWLATYFLALDTRVPPFDDVRVRRALNFAVDRERLRDLVVGQGLGQVTCQILPPDFDGYRSYCPYTSRPNAAGVWSAPNLARARQLVRASGTAGQTVTIWIPKWTGVRAETGRYVVSVLDSLGYKARLRIAAQPYFVEDKLHLQAGFAGWVADYAAPPGFVDAALTCASYNPVNKLNSNFAEFCDPSIDREIARAQSLQTSDPEAASRLWAKVDRDITDQAPWVPFANGVVLEVVSARVGNYEYNPQWGTLLDQLWVR